MNEQRDEPDRRPRLNLTTSQVAASALAACCASIVASYLGVAGTVIGAAVGSVIATTGAAVYAQLFRHSGAKLRRSLLVNGRVPEDPAAAGRPADGARAAADVGHAARLDARPGGRFYGARREDAAQDETRAAAPGGGATAKFWLPASSTAEQTRVSIGEPTVIAGAARGAEPTVLENDAGRPAPVRPRRIGAATAIRRYRKPVGIVASIVAVFCVSISVGFLLGGPARAAGSNSAPPAGGTTHTQRTHGGGDGGGGGFGQNPDPNPSTSSPPTASATPSTTPSPSGDGTPANTQSASPPAGAGATDTGTGNATGTAGAPTRQPLGGATNTTAKAP